MSTILKDHTKCKTIEVNFPNNWAYKEPMIWLHLACQFCCQCHPCWCCSIRRSQGISSYDICQFCIEYSGSSTGIVFSFYVMMNYSCFTISKKCPYASSYKSIITKRTVWPCPQTRANLFDLKLVPALISKHVLLLWWLPTGTDMDGYCCCITLHMYYIVFVGNKISINQSIKLGLSQYEETVFLTHVRIVIIKIRQSHDNVKLIMGILMIFILKQGH